MHHTKKMILVDPGTLEKMQQRVDRGFNNTLSSLDQEMGRILKLKNVSDDEKWLQYKQVLARFLHFAGELRTPVTLPIVEDLQPDNKPQSVQDSTNTTMSSTTTTKVEDTDLIKIQILKAVPKLSRNNAELMYDSLNSAGIITWDKLGSVTVNGRKIIGSSIIDLISDVVRNRKDTSPVGWETFAEVLKELNIPQEYISNVRRRTFIHQLQANQTTTPRTPMRRQSTLLSGNRWTPYKFSK